MFFPRSKVLCMDNRLSFLVILPFLFEEFQKLIQIRGGFTLLFALLRTFGICVIFLNHNDLIIVVRRQSIKVCILHIVCIDSKRRSDIGTTFKNRIYFVESSLGHWNLKLNQQ